MRVSAHCETGDGSKRDDKKLVSTEGLLLLLKIGGEGGSICCYLGLSVLKLQLSLVYPTPSQATIQAEGSLAF